MGNEYEMKPRKEKKLGRIPEIRVEESLELVLSRRANFEGRTLTNYIAHILRLHAWGVDGVASMSPDDDENQ